MTKHFSEAYMAAQAAELLATIRSAHTDSPYMRPVMTTPPTITVGNHDATLTVNQLANGNVLSAAGNQVAWYGGTPTIIASAYVAMPVTSVLPSTNGNIGFGLSDLNQWAHAAEIMTDSDKVEFGIYTNSAVKHLFQVDGQYVDFVGTAGTSPTNADTYFKLAFASRKPRRIRVLIPNLPSAGASFLKNINLSAGCSFWKPSSVYRVAWGGDSYSEGTNGAASIYPIPNAAWPVLTCELLGLRDCRQLAVGSTGYVSNANGTRSKFFDQIPRWDGHGPFDLIVFAHGYNDSSSPAATLKTEVMACLARARQLYPNVPIVVLGCQAGNAAPNASQIACEGAIQSAVAAFGDPFVKFAPVSTDTPTWLNSGNASLYVDADNTHPNVAGAEYLAYRSRNAITAAIQSMIT